LRPRQAPGRQLVVPRRGQGRALGARHRSAVLLIREEQRRRDERGGRGLLGRPVRHTSQVRGRRAMICSPVAVDWLALTVTTSLTRPAGGVRAGTTGTSMGRVAGNEPCAVAVRS